MALTSTLYTGLSGLNVNQTRLNVVGNNIANVNTVAFKSSRTLFKPQFYVTDSAGSPPSADFGGTNPDQRGLGASVASIDKNWSTGSIEPTGRDTDMAIDGNGFFIVNGKEQKYTRDGSFSLNQENHLVTSEGDFVQGFGVDAKGDIINGSLGKLNIPLGQLTKAEATTEASFVGNLNAGGPVASGSSVLLSQSMSDSANPSAAPTDATLLVDLRDSANSPLIASGDTLSLTGKRGQRDIPTLKFEIDGSSTLGELRAFLSQGMQIDESVGATGSYTPGVTLVADPSGTTAHLNVTGNVGKDNALQITSAGLTRSGGGTTFLFTEDTATSSPVGESVYTNVQAYDSLGNPLSLNITAVLESKQNDSTTWRFFATSADDTDGKTFDPSATSHPGTLVGTGTFSFDNKGKLLTQNVPTISMDRDGTGAGTPLVVGLNFESLTSLSSTTSQMVGSADGQPIGSLSGFSIGANGVITGSFTNGLTTTLGQIAVATFDNQQGLIDKGGNMYITGPDSGIPKVTSPLELGSGAIRAGALESSNVDLSAEFINLIIASTGFSASSRVITTSDQLITELLNTSR